MAQWVKNPPAMQETQVSSLGQEDPWKTKWQLTPVLPGKSMNVGPWHVTDQRVTQSQTPLRNQAQTRT